MEAAVWTDPKVSDLINNDYVLITLYVDNKTPLTEPVKIVENGKERTCVQSVISGAICNV